ncbi:hypothetical protein H3Z85_05885 [Chryseobacterium indologenes]|uniref:Uncharacterized protein n=2 Tax=Chryseobacterium indologenes TaxID=253 RepID=A0A3G5YXS8_CHRID|nr:hypothetical protein [Chryseobacterium indologenes]ATN06921.1 hypothetical protein CRN76_16675 [Chryseobacterium indologenes]AYY84334.1 hypothetical protein EGX91_07120 [Chryseobacterium indologenes]AYZ34091.1 hypothetical protein EGY07_00180 [Chryseobacterium indologenes]AZB18709.1 hypothetical protein EG352_13445 [Chryseobacterium indologenes]MBF6642602.1 hypothetical protein [Chryseobacterium indologenes]
MKKILLVILFAFSSFLMAQRVKVISGNYDFLKDQKFIKVVFKYGGLTFTRKKISEQEYITQRMAEIEKGSSKENAEKWKQDWEYSKSKTFQDKFLASWNKNTDIEASTNFEITKYTLIVEPTWISQGAFIGLGNIPAQMNSKISFVETNNPDHVVMVVEGIKATGDNVIGIPNNNDRIAECFAKTSKMLALKVDYYTRK